jgi:putative intracellular protease/amidase
MSIADKKVLVLAADLFEDMELLYPVYRLREENVSVTVAGLDDKPFRCGFVTCVVSGVVWVGGCGGHSRLGSTAGRLDGGVSCLQRPGDLAAQHCDLVARDQYLTSFAAELRASSPGQPNIPN